MSLRTRIAAAGAFAVAVTVLLAAVIIYLGVRAELRGEVDTALGSVADARGGALRGARRRRPAGPRSTATCSAAARSPTAARPATSSS